MNLTDNEKKIITLLSNHYPKSKKNIANQCGISWATTVKMVSRLDQKGILECAGTDVKEQNVGKNAYVYQLSYTYPLSIGIDVEYLNTHLILHNLKGDVLGSMNYKTPIKPGIEDLKMFLLSCIHEFIYSKKKYNEHIIGIGIGMPLWILNDRQRSFDKIKEFLVSHTQLPVQIENNIHNYAIHEKWHGNAFPYRNFVIVTIRNGIGASIFLNGRIVKGAQGVAGEIGHLQLDEDGQLCHCGKRGCLETLINQNILYTEYIRNVLHQRMNPKAFTDEKQIADSLADFMSLIKEGNPGALQVIEKPIKYLSLGIAALTLLLNIPTIFIVGHFGPDGDALLPLIEKDLMHHVVPETEINLHYLELQELSFTKGASLLIFNDYFADI